MCFYFYNMIAVMRYLKYFKLNHYAQEHIPTKKRILMSKDKN